MWAIVPPLKYIEWATSSNVTWATVGMRLSLRLWMPPTRRLPAGSGSTFSRRGGDDCRRGLAATAVAVLLAFQHFPRYGTAVTLIPDSQLPRTDEEAGRRSADLVSRFPDDPRSHWLRAITLIKASRTARRERAAGGPIEMGRGKLAVAARI
jgi:hypothetical protein